MGFNLLLLSSYCALLWTHFFYGSDCSHITYIVSHFVVLSSPQRPPCLEGGRCGRRRRLSDDIDLSVTNALQALHFNYFYILFSHLLSTLAYKLTYTFLSLLLYTMAVHKFILKTLRITATNHTDVPL